MDWELPRGVAENAEKYIHGNFGDISSRIMFDDKSLFGTKQRKLFGSGASEYYDKNTMPLLNLKDGPIREPSAVVDTNDYVGLRGKNIPKTLSFLPNNEKIVFAPTEENYRALLTPQEKKTVAKLEAIRDKDRSSLETDRDNLQVSDNGLQYEIDSIFPKDLKTPLGRVVYNKKQKEDKLKNELPRLTPKEALYNSLPYPVKSAYQSGKDIVQLGKDSLASVQRLRSQIESDNGYGAMDALGDAGTGVMAGLADSARAGSDVARWLPNKVADSFEALTDSVDTFAAAKGYSNPWLSPAAPFKPVAESIEFAGDAMSYPFDKLSAAAEDSAKWWRLKQKIKDSEAGSIGEKIGDEIVLGAAGGVAGKAIGASMKALRTRGIDFEKAAQKIGDLAFDKTKVKKAEFAKKYPNRPNPFDPEMSRQQAYENVIEIPPGLTAKKSRSRSDPKQTKTRDIDINEYSPPLTKDDLALKKMREMRWKAGEPLDIPIDTEDTFMKNGKKWIGDLRLRDDVVEELRSAKDFLTFNRKGKIYNTTENHFQKERTKYFDALEDRRRMLEEAKKIKKSGSSVEEVATKMAKGEKPLDKIKKKNDVLDLDESDMGYNEYMQQKQFDDYAKEYLEDDDISLFDALEPGAQTSSGKGLIEYPSIQSYLDRLTHNTGRRLGEKAQRAAYEDELNYLWSKGNTVDEADTIIRNRLNQLSEQGQNIGIGAGVLAGLSESNADKMDVIRNLDDRHGIGYKLNDWSNDYGTE